MSTETTIEVCEIVDRYPVIMYDLEAVKRDHLRLLELSGATQIVIQGSTPSWNDGDVCYHSECVFDEPTMCDHYDVLCFDDPNRTDDDETLDRVCHDVLAIGTAQPEILWALEQLKHVRTNLFNTDYKIVMTRNSDGSLAWAMHAWNPEW